MDTSAILEMEEIERLYDGEYVLLDEIEVDESGWVVRGRVRSHAPEAEDLDSPASLAVRSGAMLFIGEPEWKGDIALAYRR